MADQVLACPVLALLLPPTPPPPTPPHTQVIREVIEKHAALDKTNIGWDDMGWAVFMGFEHERIHIETSSVLIREVRPMDHRRCCWPLARDGCTGAPAPAARPMCLLRRIQALHGHAGSCACRPLEMYSVHRCSPERIVGWRC